MELLPESVSFRENFFQSSGGHSGATQRMKIPHSPEEEQKLRDVQSREHGSVLLVVMMVAGLILLGLGSYLTLASQENRTVKRSLCWNAALPMAEAGVEEA